MIICWICLRTTSRPLAFGFEITFAVRLLSPSILHSAPEPRPSLSPFSPAPPPAFSSPEPRSSQKHRKPQLEVTKDRLTGQREKNDPIHHQDRPEDRDVEHLKPSTQEANGHRPRSAVPEFEFRQAADEGAEFLVPRRWEGGALGVTVFEAFVLGEGGVEFGLEEGEEEVQEVYAEGVADCRERDLVWDG